jgi:hypothetical protein
MRKIRRFDAFVLFSVICCSPFPLERLSIILGHIRMS